MDIIIEGKLVKQGDAELEFPTEDWAVDFGKFVEARSLNVAELVERFTGKNGAQIHSALRTELNRNQAKRQENYVPSVGTDRLVERAWPLVMATVDDDPELLRDLRRAFVNATETQAAASLFIKKCERALRSYGVEVPWKVQDDSAAAGSDSGTSGESGSTGRFEDDDDSEA